MESFYVSKTSIERFFTGPYAVDQETRKAASKLIDIVNQFNSPEPIIAQFLREVNLAIGSLSQDISFFLVTDAPPRMAEYDNYFRCLALDVQPELVGRCLLISDLRALREMVSNTSSEVLGARDNDAFWGGVIAMLNRFQESSR